MKSGALGVEDHGQCVKATRGSRWPSTSSACALGSADTALDAGHGREQHHGVLEREHRVAVMCQHVEPAGITVAPDGDPWYAMRDANKIATLQLP